MPNFYIAVSGLKAQSTALDTIANNLSNMSTTAYKAQTTTFSDALYQEIGSSGSGNAIQVGSGTQVATNTTDFTTGTISSASSSSDMAISGEGFFVLDNGGSQLYTKNGAFEVSSDGTLETSGGLAVMGYSATNGVVNTSGSLTDITIPTGTTMAASATTSFSATQNLNSSAAVGDTTTSPVKVYDSLGKEYTATVTYTKTATNEWSYSITMPDTLTSASTTTATGQTDTYTFGSSGGTYATVNSGTNLTVTITDSVAGTTTTTTLPTLSADPETIDDYVSDLNAVLGTSGVTASNVSGVLTLTSSSGTTTFTTSGSVIQDPVASTIATGTLTFDSSGNLTSPSADISGISFTGLSDGAASLSLSWDLFGTTGSSVVTQTAADSSTTATSQNGYASGTYESFTVDSAGVVTASFSNGEDEIVGQLAIATVSNQQGLKAEGSTEYSTTTSSGTASIGVAGSGGRGTIKDTALEASNVDISSEFAALIIAQRAFEANSKAITTFDTVTQQAIAMIH